MVTRHENVSSGHRPKAVDHRVRRVEADAKSISRARPKKQSRTCVSGFVANFWFKRNTPEQKKTQRPKTQSAQRAVTTRPRQEQNKALAPPPKVVVRPQRQPTTQRSQRSLAQMVVSPIRPGDTSPENWRAVPVSPVTSRPR